MAVATSSYDADFFAWTQDQATALRRVAELRINLPGADLEHLAEEVEDMGNDVLAKIEGFVSQIVAHLLKLEYSPAPDPRRHWRGEITEWRATVRRRARRSPTALQQVDLEELVEDARAGLRNRHGDWAWVADLPETCPYSIGQILDPDFFPANRHGLGE